MNPQFRKIHQLQSVPGIYESRKINQNFIFSDFQKNRKIPKMEFHFFFRFVNVWSVLRVENEGAVAVRASISVPGGFGGTKLHPIRLCNS